jgi:two-component system cell cycle sensor histidine kinase/response regulator CckA
VTETLNLECAFVGTVAGEERDRIRTLAFRVDGRLAANVEYPVAGTPCAEVLAGRECVFPEGIRRLFPHHEGLAALEIEAYVAVPLLNVAGRPVGNLCVMSRRPISSPDEVRALLRLFALRAAAEIDRQRSERRFHDLFEFAPDGIVMTDRSGTVTLVNRQVETMFDYRREEVLGAPVESLMPAEMRATHGERRAAPTPVAVQGLIGGGRRRPLALRKDGTAFPVDVVLTQLDSDEGPQLIAHVRDLTEERRQEEASRRLEDQLREAQKLEAVGTLAGGIAHDFNNVLGVILGNAELAKLDVAADGGVAEKLDRIVTASSRAKGLVQQMLTFSRRAESERHLLAMPSLVSECVGLLRPTLPAGVEIAVRADPDCDAVLADATQMHQVVLNLCLNALHALAEEGGRIVVAVESCEVDAATAGARSDLTAGRYVRLTVSDDGHGMDEATRERMFEPFFTTKPAGQGTGLGLSVVHGIVKTRHGAITVHSAPGAGTTFHVYLPAQDRRDAAGPEGRGGPAGRGRRVLLVSDEEGIASLMEQGLAGLGYRVERCTRPEEALGRLRAASTRFDLVIADHAMSGMSGTELARACLRVRPDQPVLLTVDADDARVRETAREIGVRAVLTKPLTLEALGRAAALALAGEGEGIHGEDSVGG